MERSDVTEPAIIVENLVTQYGDRRILDGVSCTSPRGEITVILGRSGCGKSTLLRHLIGLARPHSGRIVILGQDLSGLDEEGLTALRRRMGVLFQGAALFGSMTVGDNVALPLREHTTLEESTIRIMTRMKLELVGLSACEDYFPQALSGGMRKRAGLARALAMDPEILFFDEPSAGLDPVTASGLDDLILSLNRTFRMTIVAVTHELASVERIAGHVVMVDRGTILFSGPYDRLLASQEERVRQFLERRPDLIEQDTEAYLSTLLGEA